MNLGFGKIATARNSLKAYQAGTSVTEKLEQLRVRQVTKGGGATSDGAEHGQQC